MINDKGLELMYGYNDYNPNDYVLLMVEEKEEHCPFCNSVLSEGHKPNCMMYEPPCIPLWIAIPMVILVFYGMYLWLKHFISKHRIK